MTVKERGHCCTSNSTPSRENPPGQPLLQTRVGTWSGFRRRMIGALSTQIVPPDGAPTDPRPLRALTTREQGDATIALIDAWAASLDVLAFYGERILNEGYIGTAEERRSIVEIARMLGYEPSPGVAASTRLAFTLQASALAPGEIELAPGIAVMSVPPEGKLPQVFETIEAVSARAEYNELYPELTEPHLIGNGDDVLWLEGIATRLEPGHTIVIAHSDRLDGVGGAWHAARVVKMEPNAVAQRTRVTFAPALSGFPSGKHAPTVIAFRQRAGIFGWNAPDFDAMNSELKGSYLQTSVFTSAFSLFTFSSDDGGFFMVPLVNADWPNFNVGSGPNEPSSGAVQLDRETDLVAPRGWVYLADEDDDLLGRVEGVKTVSRVDWTLTGKVTEVAFDDTSTPMIGFQRRGTVVHIGSEELSLAKAPITDPLPRRRIRLTGLVPEMKPGRTVLIAGTPASGGEPVVLEAVVGSWEVEAGASVLVLEEDLPVDLARASVKIWGNTALASHGSTVAGEVLGTGDATQKNQRFPLRQAPLTWISAATPSGATASIELRVNGVEWQRVDNLYGAGPNDRVFVCAVAEDGSAEVVTGDGVHGARVPTGQDVVATYRKGIGLDGEVGANLLTLLQTRPVGLFGVNNPAKASGAADPESLEDARRNAPLKVLTLDRLVSLSDYADFARAFAGIGKARATKLWDGRRGFVQLTVGSASGAPFAAGDELLDALEGAIEAAGDPTHVVRIASYEEVRFRVTLKLAVDPAYLRSDVEDAVRQALIAAYGFSTRDFGQAVSVSELAATVHTVEGVIAADIDALFLSGEAESLSAVLRAALPSWTGGDVTPAELLLVDPEGIEISEMEA